MHGMPIFYYFVAPKSLAYEFEGTKTDMFDTQGSLQGIRLE